MAISKDDQKDYMGNESENKESLGSLTELIEGINLDTETISIFLNNKFKEAIKRLETRAASQMYPALGYSYLLFMQATITMEPEHIEEASKAVKASLSICQKHRKKITLSNSLKVKNKANQLDEYSHYTDYQCHAELCYAECLLVKALLTFIQNENLLALIKGGLKLRECYKTYKVCWGMLKVKEWHNELIKTNFDTGVRIGVGGFNLLISMLPGRILKLVEFVGFKGNRTFGLNEINKAASAGFNTRQPIAALLLLTYHCFLGIIVGLPPFTEQINESKRLIAPMLKRHDSSALFRMMKARIDLISGKLEEALDGYEKAIEAQSEWRNLHDICHWELMWCHILQGDWLLGMKYAEKLSQNSRWSKAIYYYQKGAFLLQCYTESTEQLSEDVKIHLRKIFETVPKLLQRIAGKSVPVEKFTAKKSKRFFEQGENLVLPGVELIFIWNGFKLLNGNRACLEKMLALCTNTLNSLQQSQVTETIATEKSPYYYDNLALSTLLKAVCLSYLNQRPEAINLMNTVLSWSKKVKEDLYIMPFTEMELAQVAFFENRLEDVKNHLQNARSYKGYSLESRLHFRINGLNESLRKVMDPDKLSNSDNCWDHISDKEMINEIDEFHDCESEHDDKNSNNIFSEDVLIK